MIPAAYAETALTAARIEKFLDSVTDVDSFGEELKAAGHEDIVSSNMKVHENGKFSPYQMSIDALKKDRVADYKKLGAIVKKHGFKSQEDWASAGDGVMLTYSALKAGGNMPDYEEMTAQMTPETMAMMPPEAKAQMEAAMVMMKTLSSVTEEQKAVVSPYVSRIDEWIDSKGWN